MSNARNAAPFALRLDGVTKRYGDHVAVDGVSFEIPLGSIYGVLGPNGAGKTTTLRMINDILAPDEGQIRILGDLTPGREAAARIGYLPEERGVYPKMRVVDMLQFFAELRGVPGREALRRADAWLERLELSTWRKNRIQDLSKGMQQKVQFATALIHEPELLILDEPWSGLDPINSQVLREIVAEQRDAGRSILFSTHLMEQAEELCEHVFIIARGKGVLDGVLADIKRDAGGERLVALRFAGGVAAAADDPSDPGSKAAAILSDTTLVALSRMVDDYCEVELAAGAQPGQLLAALVAAEINVERFEVIQPSLRQIFVDRVGAELAADEPTEQQRG